MFFGESKKTVAIRKEERYDEADTMLRELEAKREQMREQLSQALHEIIKGKPGT
jgi:hypothetical protein